MSWWDLTPKELRARLDMPSDQLLEIVHTWYLASGDRALPSVLDALAMCGRLRKPAPAWALEALAAAYGCWLDGRSTTLDDAFRLPSRNGARDKLLQAKQRASGALYARVLCLLLEDARVRGLEELRRLADAGRPATFVTTHTPRGRKSRILEQAADEFGVDLKTAERWCREERRQVQRAMSARAQRHSKVTK